VEVAKGAFVKGEVVSDWEARADSNSRKASFKSLVGICCSFFFELEGFEIEVSRAYMLNKKLQYSYAIFEFFNVTASVQYLMLVYELCNDEL
jgi:hypothetical protein